MELRILESKSRQKYQRQWKHFVTNFMKYKQAYLINSTAFENLDDDLDAEIPLHRKSSEDEED